MFLYKINSKNELTDFTHRSFVKEDLSIVLGQIFLHPFFALVKHRSILTVLWRQGTNTAVVDF